MGIFGNEINETSSPLPLLLLFLMPVTFSVPILSIFFYSQKKREENCLSYFRFLIIAKLARPKMAAIDTIPTISVSVVIRDDAGVSGIIELEGVKAGPTKR